MHAQVGDLRDDHNYPDAKASGATSTRANVAGEYGGLGLFTTGHTWVDSRDKVFAAYPLMDNATQYQARMHAAHFLIGFTPQCSPLLGRTPICRCTHDVSGKCCLCGVRLPTSCMSGSLRCSPSVVTRPTILKPCHHDLKLSMDTKMSIERLPQ